MSATTKLGGLLRTPPFWLSVVVCVAALLPMEYIRFVVFGDQIIPLSYSMLLLLCLWHRDKRLLWGMAALFAILSYIKLVHVMPGVPGVYEWSSLLMRVINLMVVGLVVHALLNARHLLEERNALLERTNVELEASNEELAAREEEISRQNEELQAQAEELTQQTEEMAQQTEELERQGDDLRSLNEELSRHEGALRSLLESARLIRADVPREELASSVCEAAVKAMAGDACAAAMVERHGDRMVVRGCAGFGPMGPARRSWEQSRSMAALVMERCQTAYIEDIAQRPDLEIIQPAAGEPMRSLLVAPLRARGRIVGALEVFSQQPRQWDAECFRVLEWFAEQGGLLLEVSDLQRELELRRQEAEEASARKTQFLAAVSHDVRTPVNAINLLAELIGRVAQDPSSYPEVPELSRELQSNARSLVELVSDVLDLARFDSGKLDIQAGEFSLCSAVEAEVRQLQPLAASKGLALRVESESEDIYLRSDRMKLARILGNLIGNAIKFTETGGVRIACGLLLDGSAQVRIIDTGVGIPPEKHADIFDEFFQLRNPARDRTKGTGLGLAICKRLADALGIELSLHSAVGQGSTFTLTMPREIVRSSAGDDGTVAAAPSSRPPARSRVLEDVRILLVEDHHTTRRITAHLLAQEGAIVAQAETGREALHILQHETPQIVLLDLMLPDIDGSEILRRIQRDRPEALKRVLVVSGDVTRSRAEQVKNLGADGLIAKPIDIAQLVTAISASDDDAPLAAPRDGTPIAD